MSLDRQHGQVVMFCDNCGEVREPAIDEEEFADFIAAVKADGWRIRKHQDGWRHFCPDCR